MTAWESEEKADWVYFKHKRLCLMTYTKGGRNRLVIVLMCSIWS